MNTVGIWNETRYDPAWVKLLRRTLDAAGLQRVKIVAADATGDKWGVVTDMAKDPALAAAVDVVGVHYPHAESPLEAKALPQPLWSSEDGPWNGSWGGAMHLAQTFNRNYIVGKMTSTLIWSPISAYYDKPADPGVGPDVGQSALVRQLSSPAGDLGDGAHRAVHRARLEIPGQRLCAD